MNFLVSKPAQQLYAQINIEYLVRVDVAPPTLVASWGEFKVGSVSLETIAKNIQLALKLIDQARFDL